MTLERIAYVVDGFPKVTESFIATEISEVLRRGVDVTILSPRPGDGGPLHEVVRDNRLIGRTIYGEHGFDTAVDAFRPELVHAHFARSATRRARELARRLAIPFTFTAHRYDIWDRPPDDLADRAAASAGLVTVSTANVRHLVGSLGVDPERIHLIPCGIDIDRFTPHESAGGEPPLVVVVARLHPAKNLALLLDACARVRGSGIPFRVVIIGEGDERAALTAKRDALDLSQSVALVGQQSQGEVRAWWQRADIGALSSDSEGMPVSLMEAAACGVPVVATAAGGVPEMIEQDVTGIVVPCGDAPALAEALGRLLSDAEARRRMGAAARRHAVERFSVGRQVDQLLDVWSAALTAPRPAG